jgi:DNA-binding response OmpR family regulator
VVIESTQELAASIVKALTSAEFEAHVAVDGDTGLELARDLPADLVLLAVSLSAMDGMTKPFIPQQLVARIRAIQRQPRSSPSSSAVRHFGQLKIEPGTQRVRLGEKAIALSQIEYRLLNALSAESSRVMSRTELLRRVWGDPWCGDDHVIDVHISNLRHKLRDDPRDPRYVKTVRGVGFCMGQG